VQDTFPVVVYIPVCLPTKCKFVRHRPSSYVLAFLYDDARGRAVSYDVARCRTMSGDVGWCRVVSGGVGQACLFSGIRVIFGGPPEIIGCYSTENKGYQFSVRARVRSENCI
jgi:hypothetical protein